MTDTHRGTPTAIVTGAAGFLGSHVARAAVAAGYRVLGIGHSAGSSLLAYGINRWLEADVSLEGLQELDSHSDVIFHCAGGASVAASLEQPLADFNRTVYSTASVLEFARRAASPPIIIVPSSAAVYGSAEVLPISVRGTLNPTSPYGVHKRMGEELARSYARQYGLKVSVVRLFSVYGPGLRKQLLWDASCRLSKGEAEFGGTGNETRDWLHVEDATSLLLRATDHASAACPIVNGGSGVGVPIRSVIEDLAHSLAVHVTPSFSGVSRPGDPTDYVADISEALQWGWHPTRALSDGLREYAHWFQETVA